MKTIKELSESIGISKVSIYKLLKRNDIKGHVFKKDNVSMIDETGEQLIKNYYSREQGESINDIVNDIINDDSQVKSSDIISLLQEQLREKDGQINALLNIVTNQQKLQATQYIVDNQPIPPTGMKSDKSKKTFFGKFFKK